MFGPFNDLLISVFRPFEASITSSLGLIFLASSLLVALRWHSTAGGQDDVVQRALRFAAHIALAIGLWGVCVVLSGGLATTVSVLAVAILLSLSARRRRDERGALARMLAWTTRRQLPLAPMVAAFAREQPRAFRTRTLALADRLASGLPLAEALRKPRRLLSRKARVALLFGQQLNDASRPIDEMLAIDRDVASLWSGMAGRVLPLAFVAILFPPLGTFVATRISPAMMKIAEDFRISPTTFLAWMDLLRHTIFSEFGYVLIVVVWTYLYWCLAYYLDLGGPPPPGVRGVVLRAERTLILRWLSAAIAEGRPLTTAAEVLSREFPSGRVRRRMLGVLRDTYLGEPLSAALANARLIRAVDRPVLDTAERAGNLGWAVRAVAENNWRRYIFRLQAVFQVLFPLVVLALGLLAMFTAQAVFGPLMDIMHSQLRT